MILNAFSRNGMLLLTALGVALPATALKTSSRSQLLNPSRVLAPACGATRPAFLTRENRTEISGGFESLPKKAFVAREAQMWVESQDEKNPLKLHAYQSFERNKETAQVLCGNAPTSLAERFSLMAPTLVDLNPTKEVGNSLWQFQVIADRGTYSVWNKKSHSMTKSVSLESLFKNRKSSYRLYQVGQNEYELLVQKDVDGVTQTLSVRYESLR